MKPIKLNVNTKLEKYPIIIGSNIIKNLDLYLKKNSINFHQCLLIIDKKIPNHMIGKITKSLKKKKIFKFLFDANEKNKNLNNVEKILQLLLNKNFSRLSNTLFVFFITKSVHGSSFDQFSEIFMCFCIFSEKSPFSSLVV